MGIALIPRGLQHLSLCRVSLFYFGEGALFRASLGTILRNATNATYMTMQAKRASQGFIGQAERTRGITLN